MNAAQIERLVRESMKEGMASKRFWAPEEDAFLKENIGFLTDEEMGARLGRSGNAVKQRRKRELDLPSPSKNPLYITAQKAAKLLSLDEHKIASWVDSGLIPGRLMAGRRKIRLIERHVLRRWALNPMNWMYFDPHKVRPGDLKHMIELRMKRWNDEWWPTERVAIYHGVDTSDVKRLIKDGRISAFQPQHSLGGRHPLRGWARWFVRKSVATDPSLVFHRRGEDRSQLTERGRAWLVRAMKLGLCAAAIARTMKRNNWTVSLWIKKYYPGVVYTKGAWKKTRKAKR